MTKPAVIVYTPAGRGGNLYNNKEGTMEREDIIILDSGIDIADMESLGPCCKGASAPVR
ncbi:MAG: hypothetical protein GXP46_06765 [Deferribacteres bacterium]|nr:hypothetical protein [Deferribacteres bacterium]